MTRTHPRSVCLDRCAGTGTSESGKPFTIRGDFLLRDGKIAEARDAFKKALTLEKDRYPIHQQVLQLDLQLVIMKAWSVMRMRRPNFFRPPRGRTCSRASAYRNSHGMMKHRGVGDRAILVVDLIH
ncbi:MAG: hypothetical protein IPI81_14060 [Flavobacteriales bacterium]|nr:hypothetical protein [Flavobacteriales bacterium]